MTGKLQICKASAGSGKTHKLTGEYLQMLFKGSRDAYRSILAVTFTNKATSEMKQRILKELKRLADTPETSPFYTELLGCVKDSSSQTLQRMAQNHLIAILNDYSYFNISTIDRFFQKVLRSFAMETGHFTSYNVQLDDNIVLGFVVDELMDSIDENPELFNWMVDMSYESVKNGGNWDTVPLLLSLGKELFSEKYRMAVKSADGREMQKTDVGNVGKRMRQIEMDSKSTLLKAGRDALAIMERYGLVPSDFSGGTRSHALLFGKLADGEIKLPGRAFVKAVEGGVEKWYAKGSKRKTDIIAAYNDGLKDIAKVLAEGRMYVEYFTAVEIRRNLAVMGVFSDLEAGVRNYCRRNNMVLLSQTVQFLTQIIDGSETPFIYEKIGGRLSNYLLDEFQDTSTMQWDSFKPLVKDSVDSNNCSLIVGDVKQSIYRWRSSDWELLGGKVEKDKAFEKKVEVESLQYNWRSSAEVVKFNNDFFSAIGGMLEKDTVSEIYKDVAQKLPERDVPETGHLYVKFFEGGKGSVFSSEQYFEELTGHIERLLSNGYLQKDIALLVRTNGEAAELSGFLISKGYSVVTDDSLKLSNSRAVNKIVNILEQHNAPDRKYIDEMLEAALEGMDWNMPLYDLCEELLRRNNGSAGDETAYIVAFLDAVAYFTSLYGSDLTGFLRWWDSEGSAYPVSMPEGQNALKVLTIHKSKGLEFPAVIIPRLSFGFESGGKSGKSQYFWCMTDDLLFDAMPYYPLEIRQSLENTVFKDDYEREKLYSIIDTCNVAYVAFTRAEKELIILSHYKEDSKGNVGNNSISGLLYNFLKNNMTDGVYESGRWTLGNAGRDEGSDAGGELSVSNLPSMKIGTRLRLALSGDGYFSEENVRRNGIVLHDILANVKLASDVPSAVMDAVEKGLISFDAAISISSRLEMMIAASEEYHWFDGTYKLLLETPILTPEGDNYRPDRIMISKSGEKAIVVDYKFGHKKEMSHSRQVVNYARLLLRMGFSEVSSYLWYENEILFIPLQDF